MRSILLAAGFGTRLLPLTEEKPKAIIPIVNKPIINILIEKLKKSGFNEIGINTHYKPGMVTDAVKKSGIADVKVKFQHEPEILNTGGGLASFREFIGEQQDFIVHNCDIISDIDIAGAMEYHKKAGAIVTLILVDNPPKNSVLVNDKNEIIDIGSKRGVKPGKNDIILYGAGIFIYNRKIFDYLATSEGSFPLIPHIMKIMDQSPKKVRAYVPPGSYYWKDMGSLKSYFDIHRDILLDKKINIVKTEDRKIGLMGNDCKIGSSAKFKGFYCLGNNVVVEKDCLVENCVAWDDVVLKADEIYKNCIISVKNRIDFEE